jgi:chromate reductase
MSKPRFIALSGSLRQGSFSTAVLRGLADAAASRAEIVVHTLGEEPLYNQDLDTDTPPEGVARLRAAIAEADGVIIVSPEFNYGLPGVLKNALDWASRPYGVATITGKPVMVATASPAFTGGARAQAPLNEVLLAIGARPLRRPQTVIAAVHEKVQDGRLVDEATLDFLLAGVDDLIRDIQAHRPSLAVAA